MPGRDHPLSLAAGTVLDLDPAAVVRCAADVGCPMAGVRLPGADPRTALRPLATALAATGVELLDVEYVRLVPGPLTDDQRRVAVTAAELGARHLLVVSDDPDEAATCAKLAELGELLAGAPTRPALEFMMFTAVRTHLDAARIARAVPGVVVVLDVLHLHRAATVSGAGTLDPALVGYAQLCDVARREPPAGLDGLADEARHHREAPGRGVLALDRFVAGLPPACPISVEVQSARLTTTLAPAARATLALESARAVLAEVSAGGAVSRATGRGGYRSPAGPRPTPSGDGGPLPS